MSSNINTLVAVSAYAGDSHQVKNNMPTYLHHKCPVLIMSPEDAPIERMDGAMCMVGGLRCWAGQKALDRQIKFLEILLHFPYEHYLFHDADSICLSPEIPAYLYEEDTIWSNEVLDTNPGLSMLPKIAMQPPYFFSRRALRGMLACKGNLPTSYYGDQKTPEGWPLPIPTECPDHLMLQLAHGSGFGHKNFLTGASFETASPHGLETMVGLVRHHGRVLVHSVKTKLVLDRLLQEHAIYRR
jgi:hypothetical protein